MKNSLFSYVNLNTFKDRANLILYYFWQNRRLRTGIIFLMILAPLSKYIYMLFPTAGFGDYLLETRYLTIPNFIESSGWFYEQLYWFFFTIGDAIAAMLTMAGVFFLFPKKYYPSYLVGVPFGYFLGLFFTQVTATSNEDLHNLTPTTIGFAMVVAIVGMAISDHLLFKENHRKRATEARLVGLINMPGMTWEDKEDLLKKEAKRMMKEDNELFSRTA